MLHVDDGQLNALLDNELDAAEQADVRAHLGSCAQCRARLDEARAFLVESGELLEQLGGTGARGHGGMETGGTGAQGHGGTEQPKTPAKTVQEPALNIDGRTAKTIASPFFPQAADRIAAQAAREQAAAEAPLVVTGKPARRFGETQLAWAASVILAIGVGFLANEVWNLRSERAISQVAAETDQLRDAAGPAEPADPAVSPANQRSLDRELRSERASRPPAAAARPPARIPATSDFAASGAGTSSAAPRAAAPAPPTARPMVIPPVQRRDKPPEAAGDRVAANALEEAGVTTGATQGPAQAPPATQLGRVDAAAPAAGARPADPNALSVRSRAPLNARLRPNTFRPISGDSAIRSLSGSMRLVDGLRPQRIEIGPGTLVPGADTGREVVRVHYLDSLGRRLVLDQQPGDAPAATVNGLMRGDTLVTNEGESTRVRWIDRKNFWLSLTGPLTAEELRGVVSRIR